MKMKYLLLLICCLNSFTEGAEINSNETENTCVALSFPDVELKIFREKSGLLNTYLSRNINKNVKTFKKVFSDFDREYLNNELNLEEKETLKGYLLQHKITLLNEIRELLSPLLQQQEPKIKEIKELLSDMKQTRSRMDGKNFRTRRRRRGSSINHRKLDCSDYLVDTNHQSGFYDIYSLSRKTNVSVYCDMDTDGGGWTVFLNRIKTREQKNFKKNWDDYKKRFGEKRGEYWLGNEDLHLLTTARNYELRLDAYDEKGKSTWGKWKTFKVDSEENKYKLTVERYNTESAARDSVFSVHNGQKFSTYDQDNDAAESSCAKSYKGGWWYRKCHNINPTGVFGEKSYYGIKINRWNKFNDSALYPVSLQLKIRPQDLHLRMH